MKRTLHIFRQQQVASCILKKHLSNASQSSAKLMQASEDRKKRLKALKERAEASTGDNAPTEGSAQFSNPLASTSSLQAAHKDFTFYSDPLSGFKRTAGPRQSSATLPSRPNGGDDSFEVRQQETTARQAHGAPNPSVSAPHPRASFQQPPQHRPALNRQPPEAQRPSYASHSPHSGGPPHYMGTSPRPFPVHRPHPPPGPFARPMPLRLPPHFDSSAGSRHSHSGRGRGRARVDKPLPSQGFLHPSMWEDPWAALTQHKGAKRAAQPAQKPKEEPHQAAEEPPASKPKQGQGDR